MIVIMGAMDSEVEGFARELSDTVFEKTPLLSYRRGTLLGHEVVVLKCGVGKVLSAMVSQHVIDVLRPEAMLFTGLAGSLKPELRIGDMIAARDLVQHDMIVSDLGFERGQIPYSPYRFIESDRRLLELARNYRPVTGTFHIGRICTGDTFHSDEWARRGIVEELDGDAVEMEGASVAVVCTANRVPFLVVRTISDMADGSASVAFSDFLPFASDSSVAFVKYLLERY